MRSRLGRWLFAVGVLMLFTIGNASAAERLRGVVLEVDSSKGQAIVRHDAFGGMPSMTMPFRIPDRASLEKLRVGNGIEADVDEKTEPWTLRNVRVGGSRPVADDGLRTSKRLQLGDTVPATAFVDQNGRAFTFDDARGRYAIVSFIYTRCRDARMCPLISAKFAQLQNKIDAGTHLYEVTLDPDYDRPPVLRKYAQTFGFRPDRVTLLTGDPNAVLDFAAMFGLSAFADPTYGLIHNENTAVIDRSGRVGEMITENTWSPEELVSVVDGYEHRPANPLAQLDLALTKTAVAICGNGVAGFSGLMDLVVVVGLLGAGGWLMFRIARGIARGST